MPLPLPPHFDPERVGEVWKVAYEERAAEARAWAAEHGITPAADDDFRVCLLAVDIQNTFCLPGFELFVGGAVEDNRRLCEFVYRNLGRITHVVASLDTHRAMQVFHAAWLVDEEGRHPAPYTLITAEDVERGTWRVDPAAARRLALDEDYAQRHLLHYTRALETGGKYVLTIWPYHALLGGIGHVLVSAVEEALFFHGVARATQPELRVKGESPLTEHYSVLGPEITSGPDGEAIGAKDEALVKLLRGYDAVLVAGQAKSHCVAWTVEDLLDAGLAGSVYLLEDCSSPVVVPGVVDYTGQADEAYRRFADAGMRIVRSTDPIEEWLDREAWVADGKRVDRSFQTGGGRSPPS